MAAENINQAPDMSVTPRCPDCRSLKWWKIYDEDLECWCWYCPDCGLLYVIIEEGK